MSMVLMAHARTYTGVSTTGAFQVSVSAVINAANRNFYPSTGSPLINAGNKAYTSPAPKDFNGTPRSATTPTVGAYVRVNISMRMMKWIQLTPYPSSLDARITGVHDGYESWPGHRRFLQDHLVPVVSIPFCLQAVEHLRLLVSKDFLITYTKAGGGRRVTTSDASARLSL